jgi:hypothetical protein
MFKPTSYNATAPLPPSSDKEMVEAVVGVVTAAQNLVALWKEQKVSGLPRAERNAAIEDTRARLIEAVDELATNSTAAPAGDTGWRDIESAPRDGTHIIGGKEGIVGEVRYCEDEGHEGFYWADQHWTDAVGGEPIYLTHWRPLPSLPAPGSKG